MAVAQKDPALTTILYDRVVYEYDVIPFFLLPLTLPQVLEGVPKTLPYIGGPDGIELNVTPPRRDERYYASRITLRGFGAALLQNSVNGLGYGWGGLTLGSYGNLNNYNNVSIDGERPRAPFFQGLDTIHFPRIINKIKFKALEAFFVSDFASLTDGVNMIPDPAGPNILVASVWVTVELLKDRDTLKHAVYGVTNPNLPRK